MSALAPPPPASASRWSICGSSAPTCRPPTQEAVYQRMTSNLQQQAAQIRAQGEAARARDHRRRRQAGDHHPGHRQRESAFATRGAGDAQAAQLFAAAFGKDPSFAAFYRSMQAYQDALAQKDTTLVLSPDSDFLKYFRQGPDAR